MRISEKRFDVPSRALLLARIDFFLLASCFSLFPCDGHEKVLRDQ